MRTLEIKYTLTPSHVDADWISTFFVFQKSNAPGAQSEGISQNEIFFFVDAIIAIGLLDTGCVKLWAFDPRTATTNVRIMRNNFYFIRNYFRRESKVQVLQIITTSFRLIFENTRVKKFEHNLVRLLYLVRNAKE